jgi:hypothetical protein
MASQRDEFRKVMRDDVKIRSWIPVWRPGADIRLGSVGVTQEGEFRHQYVLTDRGLELPKQRTPDRHPDD